MSTNSGDVEEKMKKNVWKTGSIINSARSASIRSYKIITQAMRKLSKMVKPSQKNKNVNKMAGESKGEPVKSETEKAAVCYQKAAKSSETKTGEKVVVDVGPVCVAKMVGAIETKVSKDADQKVKITKTKPKKELLAAKWPPKPVADVAAKVVKGECVKKTALPTKKGPLAHESSTSKTEPADKHRKSHQPKKTGNNETTTSPARQVRPMTPANSPPESLDGANAASTDLLSTPATALAPASTPKRSYVTTGRLMPSATVRRTPAVPRGPPLWDDASSNASTLRPITATTRAPASSRDDAASTSSWLTTSTLRSAAASRNDAESTCSGSSASTMRPMTATARVPAASSRDDAASTSSWLTTSTLRFAAASRDGAESTCSGSSASTMRPMTATARVPAASRDDAASTCSWLTTSTLRSAATSRDGAESTRSGSSTSTLRPVTAAPRAPTSNHSGSSTATLRPVTAAARASRDDAASTRSWMTTTTLRTVTASNVGHSISTVVKPVGVKNRQKPTKTDGDETCQKPTKTDGKMTATVGNVLMIDGDEEEHVEGSEVDSRAGDFDGYDSEIFRRPAEDRTLNSVQKTLLAADRRAFAATSRSTIATTHTKRCDAHLPRPPVPHPLSFAGQERREAVFPLPKRKDRVEEDPNLPCLAERQQTAKKVYGNTRPARLAPPSTAIGTSAYVNDKAKTWEIKRRNNMLTDKILRAKSSIPKRR